MREIEPFHGMLREAGVTISDDNYYLKGDTEPYYVSLFQAVTCEEGDYIVFLNNSSKRIFVQQGALDWTKNVAAIVVDGKDLLETMSLEEAKIYIKLTRG